MKVDRVRACIRYSQDTGKGAWKVVEVGAEGTVGAQEGWRQAQAKLYSELNVWCELRETRNHYSRRKGASGR